jgi:predicted DNA-binding WGR domain protein
MPIEIGDAVLRVGVDNSDFKKGMDEIQTQTQKIDTQFRNFERVSRPLGIALTSVGAAGLMAANATKDWNNALSGALQRLKPVFAALTGMGIALMVGVKAVKALRIALIALKAQAISTAAAFGVVGLVVGGIAAALSFASGKTRDYTESIGEWDNALQSAQGRLRELEDAGQGASAEAGNLRDQIEYLTTALDEFSDLSKTNEVTETQLNEAWAKRNDLIKENETLTKTRNDLIAQSTDRMKSFTDSMTSVLSFNQVDDVTERLASTTAELADNSTDYQEITSNIITLLRGETFTVDELTDAYATADDELKVLIQDAIDFKRSMSLEEVTKEADANLKDAISYLEELYGLRANETKSLIDQLEDETDAQKKYYDGWAKLFQTATANRIKGYQNEYDVRVKLLDAETEAVVGALQAQLDALDAADKQANKEKEDRQNAGTEAELRAATDYVDIEKEAELKAALAAEWTRAGKEKAQEELTKFYEEQAANQAGSEKVLADFLTGLADKRAADERDAQRTSLEGQIQDVQTAAEERRTAYQADLDAKVANENAMLAAAESTIQGELDALQAALEIKRGILQQELNDAVAVQNQIRDNAITAINAVIDAQLAAANTPVAPITFGGGPIGNFMNEALHAAGVPGYAGGGDILEPTLLSSMRTGRPYAIAGENGPERVVPGGGGGNVNITGTFYIREEADIPKVARELHRLRMRKGNMGS